MPTSKIDEFERQLKGQENGLNRLTADEYLKNVANPIARDPAVAKLARTDLHAQLQSRYYNELLQTMDALDAEEVAFVKAKETMASLAGLHNPDLSAGGNDFIDDFGDRQVNSSIGAQWRSRIKSLKNATEAIPLEMRGKVYLNVRLHKC